MKGLNTFRLSDHTIRSILLFVLALGLVLRLSYVWPLAKDPQTLIAAYSSDVYDQFRFMRLAGEFAGGNWLGPAVKYSPAYSYLIAVLFRAFSENMLSVFVFQALAGTLAIFLFYKTAALLFGNKTIGLTAAFVAALYGPFVFYEGALLRASLIAVCNLGGFYFLLAGFRKSRSGYFLLSGLLVGLSFVLRPNALPLVILPCLLIGGYATFRRRSVFTVIFLGGILLFAAPVSLRNKAAGKNSAVSSQGASTFWIGNTPDTNGVGLYRSPLREQFAAEANGSLTKTAAIFAREVKKNPRQYLRIYATKILMFLNGYEVPANLSYDLAWEDSLILKLCFFGFGIVCPLALLGIAAALEEKRDVRLALLFLLTLSLSAVLFHIQGRYRLPAVPFFILFAAYAVHWAVTRVPQLDRTMRLKVSALFLLFLLLTAPHIGTIRFLFGAPVPPFYYHNKALCQYLLYTSRKDDTDFSVEEKQAALRPVLAYLDRAFKASSPKNLDDRIMYLVSKGNILEELGETKQAAAVFQEALRVDPNRKDLVQSLIDQKEMFLPELAGPLPF